MIPSVGHLFVGMRFDLPTRPGHAFHLDGFARPYRLGDSYPRWSDLGVDYVACERSDATHVHGWSGYMCFLTIERILREGRQIGYTGRNVVGGHVRVTRLPRRQRWDRIIFNEGRCVGPVLRPN